MHFPGSIQTPIILISSLSISGSHDYSLSKLYTTVSTVRRPSRHRARLQWSCKARLRMLPRDSSVSTNLKQAGLQTYPYHVISLIREGLRPRSTHDYAPPKSLPAV